MMGLVRPKTLIIRTAGTNCDRELAHAFELAGASTQTVHLNRLINEPGLLDQANLIGLPGGFSYGDDIAAGRILANRLGHHLSDGLKAAVDRGVPVIGICNGFQVLVKLGLLPDPAASGPGHVQAVTLTDNQDGRFVARWVKLEVPQDTVCVWTGGLGQLEWPIAHGEGRFVAASDQVLTQLVRGGQVASQYAGSEVCKAETGDWAVGNPNGSANRVAGICDRSGLVLGLMPHPERDTHPTHHPGYWTGGVKTGSGVPAGLRLFQNAVEYVVQTATGENKSGPVVADRPAGSQRFQCRL